MVESVNQKNSNKLYIFASEGKVVLPAESCREPFWYAEVAQPWLSQQQNSVTVGSYRDKSCIAVEVNEETVEDMVAADAELVSLRYFLDQGEELFALVGRGVQLLNSYREHRHCGRCGQPTETMQGEHATRCASCNHSYYPRLSPCAIMLVTRGEHCLLARHGGRGDYFTCLAGYVEPGEQVEQTVRREVLEEVGVTVAGLSYFSSQCWPFPGQLMLGFYADYQSGDITPDGVEIVEADWYHYSDLPAVPGPHTLSGQLIRGFVSRHSK